MITRYQKNIVIKEFLPSVSMVIISVLLIFYALIPGIKHGKEIWVSIETVNKENAVLKKKINTLSQFDEGTLSGYVDTLLSAVPPDKSIASILSTIDSVALKNNVMVSELTILNPGSISTDSASVAISNSKLGSNTIKISAGVIGAEKDVFSFIANIRKVRRLMRVSTVSQTFSETVATHSATTKLELEAFYANLPVTLGKIESEIQPLSANEESLITILSGYPVEYEIIGSGTQNLIESGNKIDPFSF